MFAVLHGDLEVHQLVRGEMGVVNEGALFQSEGAPRALFQRLTMGRDDIGLDGGQRSEQRVARHRQRAPWPGRSRTLSGCSSKSGAYWIPSDVTHPRHH